MEKTAVPPVNPRRAVLKMISILAVVLLVLAGLIHFFSDQMIDELKHSFSVWTIITLILIVNLVSFVCVIVMFAAYRWVRGDLRPRRDELDNA